MGARGPTRQLNRYSLSLPTVNARWGGRWEKAPHLGDLWDLGGVDGPAALGHWHSVPGLFSLVHALLSGVLRDGRQRFRKNTRRGNQIQAFKSNGNMIFQPGIFRSFSLNASSADFPTILSLFPKTTLLHDMQK